MLCQMMNKMEQLRKTFQNEIFELWEDDREHYEDADDFIEFKYNSVELTKYECLEFVGNDYELVFKMEEEVCKYNVDEFGEEWTERGICKIVMFWKYMVARDYVNQHLQQY